MAYLKGYKYDKQEDYYFINHNSFDLQFQDNKLWKKYIGRLLIECFYTNNIYNIAFGYDYELDKNKKNIN